MLLLHCAPCVFQSTSLSNASIYFSDVCIIVYSLNPYSSTGLLGFFRISLFWQRAVRSFKSCLFVWAYCQLPFVYISSRFPCFGMHTRTVLPEFCLAGVYHSLGNRQALFSWRSLFGILHQISSFIALDQLC